MLVLKDVFNLVHTKFFWGGKSSNQTSTLQKLRLVQNQHGDHDSSREMKALIYPIVKLIWLLPLMHCLYCFAIL